MDEISDAFKKHPYAVGGGVFVLGLLILYELGWFSSSAAPVATTTTSGVTSGGSGLSADQYYLGQLQLAASTAQIQGQVASNALSVSGSVNVADTASNDALAEGIAAGNTASTNLSNVLATIQQQNTVQPVPYSEPYNLSYFADMLNENVVQANNQFYSLAQSDPNSADSSAAAGIALADNASFNQSIQDAIAAIPSTEPNYAAILTAAQPGVA